jgi:Tfp pilus assembly protein PilF
METGREPNLTDSRGAEARPAGARLDSWKEIAAYFGRDERTVKRWEKERALPIHRLQGTRSRVFAFADELSAWLKAESVFASVLPEERSGGIGESGATPVGVPDEDSGDEAAGEFAVGVMGVTAGPAFSAGAVSTPHLERPRMAWWLAAPILAVCLGAIAFRIEQRKVDPQAAISSVAARTPNPEAQQLYLKGRYYWDKRTPDDLNKAVDYFTQAIVKDPGYAQAYVGLADCYNLLREYTLMPANEAYRRALSAATRAVALDDGSAEAHASLAFALFYGNWDVAGAEREFRRAIELDPQYVPAHHWYATFLMVLGRLREALSEIELAQKLNPTSTAILADKGLILYNAGRRNEAVILLKQLERSEPDFLSPHNYLAGIYLDEKDYSNYLAESKMAAELLHDDHSLAVAKAGEKGLAASGERGMLEAILAEQKKLYDRGLIPAYLLAATSARLGRNSEALDYLRVSYEKHESEMVSLRADSSLTSLHGDPAYTDLLAKVGFPPLT